MEVIYTIQFQPFLTLGLSFWHVQSMCEAVL